MNILGISLGFNSSACVYSTEKGLLAAISQERLNGQKNTKELPLEAAVRCCAVAGITNIDKIAISHYEDISDEYFERYGEKYGLAASSWQNKIISYLISKGVFLKDKNIVRVPHHISHAYSTYGFYGKPYGPHYLITSDGFGDGESATIRIDGMKESSIALKNSVALVYQFVTGALGFKEHQHEGKITGLAAFGKPIHMFDFEELYRVSAYGNGLDFKSECYELDDEEKELVSKSHIVDFEDFLKLKKAVYGLVNELMVNGAKRENIAATVQKFAEDYTIAWIREYTHPGYDGYIAGGLFANVKINQRIKDMKDRDGKRWFENVYVCPAMGDEGTAVGAAIAVADQEGKLKLGKDVGHVLCGTTADESEVNHWFDVSCAYKLGYKITVLKNPIEYISQKLAENKIVCLKREAMEFGPRALCHTSILYNADSRETNNWLNEKLGRTEFMPFAPVTRKEVADDLFINLDGGRDSAKFMTMTFDCTEEFAQNYQAACHVDNTARPQIISHDDDPFMWSVLDRYQELTGKKAMINTSFNLHNNPIIESTKVAIQSWLKSDTDVLVIGNYAIEKK